MLRPRRRQQIDKERHNVEGEDERNSPFEDCSGVVCFFPGAGGECDGEGDFDEDEGELDPEGGAEDEVLSVFCLVLVIVW